MTEDIHFLRETVVDIDAAVVGVSSVRWTAIPETEASAERATEMMKANRFDTLPIESEKGIKEYFQTDTWNDYSSIARRAVTHRDVIPYRTPLRNVIQGFASAEPVNRMRHPPFGIYCTRYSVFFSPLDHSA